jgi:hypothetical protein
MNAYAYVDDEDYERLVALGPWRLRVAGVVGKTANLLFYAYRVERIDGKQRMFMMHRELINVPEGYDTDHRDSNGLNNQKSNLRVATRSQNNANRRKGLECSSVYKGVSSKYFNGKFHHWQARIGCGGKKIDLGMFNNEHEAALAYNKKAKELYGEFALLNKIPDDFVAGQPGNTRIVVSGKISQAVLGPRSGCSSLYKGVGWHKVHKKFQAYICVDRKLSHLGFFVDEKEAARVYNEAALKHFGAIAYQNDV